MKRALLLLLLMANCLPGLLNAQSSNSLSTNQPLQSFLRNGGTTNLPPTTSALFDLQYDYALSRGGFAGVTWTGGDLWISKWASDSLFTFSETTGTFTSNFFISNVTGVRGMTFDGTNVWVVNNTTNIYKIDTGTKAVLDTVSAPFPVRGIAYDSAANGGAGGLWVNDYATDIVLLDYAGNVTSVIASASHGRLAMYSIAFDPYSTGGPFIWAFDQGGLGMDLVRIPISTGIPDLIHDVSQDIGGTSAAIAGGISISNFTHPGPHSIIGVAQNAPADRVFSLELDDYIPPAFDASADSLEFNPANLITPKFLVSPITFELMVTNHGTSSLDTVEAELDIDDGSLNVYSTSEITTNLSPLSSTTIVLPGTYTPPATAGATFNVSAVINTAGQTDQVSGNNNFDYTFSISDTTLSRHGASSGRIGIAGPGGGSGGTISIQYDIPSLAYATSITFGLVNPTIGDTIRGEIYGYNGGPGGLIASTPMHFITAADTGGVFLTLPFSSPVQLNPGSYLAGIKEYKFNVSIAYSLFNWRPSSTWILLTGGGWAPSEDLSFKIVPFVDLNVWTQQMVSVNELGQTIYSLYPNPASSQFQIDIPAEGSFNLVITDMQGRVVLERPIEGNGKETISTDGWSNGLYITKLENNGKSFFSKLSVNH